MYLKKLQQDEIFVSTEMKPLKNLTGMEPRRGMENAIISNGEIVNVVSKSYGYIPNELFFGKAEQMLVDANLNYRKRAINRMDRSFIIEDKNQFSLRNRKDKILPMLRFKNSYDGSEKTSGHFDFYREACTNGLHVSHSGIAFSIRHSKNNTDLILPNLNKLFDRFLGNEYYEINDKFNAMAEVEIIDNEKFVRDILESTKLFKYGRKNENDNPSNKAIEILEILYNEPFGGYTTSNLWLGYNAFNWVLHNSLKKTFSQQEKLDKLMFNEIYTMV